MEIMLFGLLVVGLVAYGMKVSRHTEEKLALSKIKSAIPQTIKELNLEISQSQQLIDTFSDLKRSARELNDTGNHQLQQLSQWSEKEGVEGKSLAEAKIRSLLQVKSIIERLATVENIADTKILIAELRNASIHAQALTESVEQFLSKYRNSSI